MGSGYSWKKPWAFVDISNMRRALTQPEVYRKLGILERHSAFEKPYYMYDHKRNQILYPPVGWRKPPYDQPDNPSGGRRPRGCAQIACNGGIVACGGCEPIICGCTSGVVTCRIISDPTGQAYLVQQGSSAPPVTGYTNMPDWQAVTLIAPLLCLPEIQLNNAMYYEIVVECCDRGFLEYDFDARGCAQATVYPLGCPPECCEAITLTGAATTNPGVTWYGSISPGCPYITCSVSSNSSCTGITCYANPSGAAVEVYLPGTACGAFTVTVTRNFPAGSTCTPRTASKTVLINNTGQGGAWNLEGCCYASATGACSTGYNINSCTIDDIRYGDFPTSGDCSGCDSSTAQFEVISRLNDTCVISGCSFPCGYYETVCDINNWPARACKYGYCQWRWNCTCS